jgi:uncharacterized protein (TIGR02217 family)
MTNFLDIKLPNFIAIYAKSIPIFSTKIITLQSGKESRYPIQDSVRFKYKISSCKLTNKQFEEFNEFFLSCRGKQYSFRMKDFQDHMVTNQSLVSGPSYERTYAIYKIYSSNNFIYRRRIYRPIINSVEVKINESPIEPVIDYSNGVIELNQELKQNENLTLSFKYDVLVRFDFDSFDYKSQSDGTILLDNLEMIEVVL